MDVFPLARRWLDRSRSPAVAVYAFGKHPAFADFVDVARLPPVPASFRHFHDALRPAVERDGGPTVPLWIAWHDRGTAALLRVQPSRDRGDEATGRFRRCPLLLGLSARAPLPTLLGFAESRVTTLAEAAMASDGETMLAAVAEAAAAWPRQWPAAAAGVAFADVGERTPVVVIAGPAGVTTDPVRLSDVPPTMLGEWLARVTATPS